MISKTHLIIKGKIVCSAPVKDPTKVKTVEWDEFERLAKHEWQVCKKCYIVFTRQRKFIKVLDSLKECFYQFEGCTGEATMTFRHNRVKARCCESCGEKRRIKEELKSLEHPWRTARAQWSGMPDVEEYLGKRVQTKAEEEVYVPV